MLYPNEAKNRFQRATEARAAAKRKATPTVSEREEKREKQRAEWLNHSRGASNGTASTKLDPQTLAARNAFLAEKAAAKSPTQSEAAPQLSEREEFILARTWADSHPDWFASPYNVATFSAIMEHFGLPANFSGFDRAFQYGQDHHHFEPKVRLRGQPAPVPFRADAPKQAEPVRSGNRPVRIVRSISEEETARLRSLSFDELKAEARSTMKAYGGGKK